MSQPEQRGLFDPPEPSGPEDACAVEAVRSTWTGAWAGPIPDPSPGLTERFRLASANWREGKAGLDPSNAWGVWADGKR